MPIGPPGSQPPERRSNEPQKMVTIDFWIGIDAIIYSGVQRSYGHARTNFHAYTHAYFTYRNAHAYPTHCNDHAIPGSVDTPGLD